MFYVIPCHKDDETYGRSNEYPLPAWYMLSTEEVKGMRANCVRLSTTSREASTVRRLSVRCTRVQPGGSSQDVLRY